MKLLKVNDKDNFHILTNTQLLLLTSKAIYLKTEAAIQRGMLKTRVNQHRHLIILYMKCYSM